MCDISIGGGGLATPMIRIRQRPFLNSTRDETAGKIAVCLRCSCFLFDWLPKRGISINGSLMSWTTTDILLIQS